METGGWCGDWWVVWRLVGGVETGRWCEGESVRVGVWRWDM